MEESRKTPHEFWREHDEIEARLTAPVSERMLALGAIESPMRVLDLASGRGEPAIRAAKRVLPLGSVLGIDVDGDSLELARARAAREAVANVEFRQGDAESLDGIGAASFDAVTVRWGLMYMRSPSRALAHARRVLKVGGVFVAAVWARPSPWATLPRQVLARYGDLPPVDPSAPGAFRYDDPESLERDLHAAGFSVVATEVMEVSVMEAASGEAIAKWWIDLGFLRLVPDLSPEARRAVECELASEAERLREGEMVRVGGVTRIVVARP